MGKTWNQKHSFSPSCFQFGLTSQKQSCKECWENKLRRHLYGWRASVQKSWRFTDPKEGLAKKNVCVCCWSPLAMCISCCKHYTRNIKQTWPFHCVTFAISIYFNHIPGRSPAPSFVSWARCLLVSMGRSCHQRWTFSTLHQPPKQTTLMTFGLKGKLQPAFIYGCVTLETSQGIRYLGPHWKHPLAPWYLRSLLQALLNQTSNGEQTTWVTVYLVPNNCTNWRKKKKSQDNLWVFWV